MPRILVSSADIDIGAELARLEDSAGAAAPGRTVPGAVASFLGLVRGQSGGKPLRAMTLEHYPGMTEKALAAIADQAMTRWRLHDCTIIHRTGRLVPGARIVLTAAASAHRADALEATQFMIDWLKTEAPFWKSEEFIEGDAAWVEARPEDDTARARWMP